ncbi:3-oxoacyl-[acyl-carrier-protein] synthase II FabB [Thermosynechococcus sp. NK55a]|uniref:beta-ketoacyl-ACP synthase n=1 Tax=unclassified Thermosynechococcus TaxID=2622553 RepID=UPI0003D82B9C|nr:MULTISPECIES: beta-ketoacyl-ACP synthase [unclassified Thermosynechococcus]AHB87683.1 3-oxoacyl-[acyl-carrier-protein] synthase II FabB [Thermosynechococcus sp. NK55a]RMH67571.1 MAG: beta-ketoacyl-ACP synthase [Cyanobacteria bacterium J003]HIK22699.1 beta-ketoacyl-ACP synthase [Thermosynechococcus sp. M3746_W2019_013]
MNVVITGIGLWTALGDTAIATWQRYCQGKTALIATPEGLVGATSLPVEKIIETTTTQALKDAKLTAPLGSAGAVVGSSRGFQAQWERWLRQPALSRETWLQTLPATVSQQVAQIAGIQGIVLNPTAACATGIWAIAQGALLIAQGDCDLVLAGGVESAISPLTLAGFRQLGVLAQERAAPFDRQRQGFGLAAGGALLVLESPERARSRGIEPYARIAGVGLSADAENMAAPSVNQTGALLAIQKALAQAELTPRQIDCIHSHGTGTRRNDAAEAAWIQTLFGQGVAVTSHKGALGHTLGAAGAIAIALSCLALREQQIPPCVGCQTPNFELDIVQQTRSAHLEHILCCSYGFGGQNAVVVLARA